MDLYTARHRIECGEPFNTTAAEMGLTPAELEEAFAGPCINEFELELTVKALETLNPGRTSEKHIRQLVRDNWPFENIATAGWVAYAEAPDRNNNVRVALTPYTVNLYLEAQA